jgi:hypothetical protein
MNGVWCVEYGDEVEINMQKRPIKKMKEINTE